jgi:hypothetical protein
VGKKMKKKIVGILICMLLIGVGVLTCTSGNTNENTPPSSPECFYDWINVTLSMVSVDPELDSIRYGVEWWRSETVDIWTDYYPSGTEVKVDVSGQVETVEVFAEDILGARSSKVIVLSKGKSYLPFGFIFVFGFDVDVKIVQLEPGEDYVDLEVLSKPFYIWENGIQIRNPGEFIRLYNAKGLFSPSLPFCFGICDDWAIIG